MGINTKRIVNNSLKTYNSMVIFNNQLHLIDKYNIDVFCHCWNPEFEKEIINLYKPKRFYFEKQVCF